MEICKLKELLTNINVFLFDSLINIIYIKY